MSTSIANDKSDPNERTPAGLSSGYRKNAALLALATIHLLSKYNGIIGLDEEELELCVAEKFFSMKAKEDYHTRAAHKTSLMFQARAPTRDLALLTFGVAFDVAFCALVLVTPLGLTPWPMYYIVEGGL